jgi:hypothetical protein
LRLRSTTTSHQYHDTKRTAKHCTLATILDGSKIQTDAVDHHSLVHLRTRLVKTSGAQHRIAIDGTNIVNDFIQAGQDFLGFRAHDAVYFPSSPGNNAQVAM